jgi:hypothetical protein
MRICIINAHLPNYEPLARITTYGNRKEYCQRHGYDLRVQTTGWTHPAIHPVTWSRFKFMRDVIVSGEYDWVWCSGTDTFHTNMTIPLESLADPDFHVVAACDWVAEFQADSYLVRNSPEALAWMDSILALYPKYKDHPWVENAAIVDTLDMWRKTIKLLPQRTMNSYHYPLYWKMYPTKDRVKRGLDFTGVSGQWEKGDFLVHWPSQTLEYRMKLAKAYEHYIIR